MKYLMEQMGVSKWIQIIGVVITGIIIIILNIALFAESDITPATPDDYKPLEYQAMAVAQNPKLLQEIDCDINIKNGISTVKFENDECEVFAIYDKNFALLSTSEKDKSKSWLKVLVEALFGSAYVFFVGVFCFSLLLQVLVVDLVKWIFEKVKNCQKKSKKK